MNARCLAIVACLASMGMVQTSSVSGDPPWERMVKAKGGREAQLRVETVLMTVKADWRVGLFSHRRYSEETFLALPGRLWRWLTYPKKWVKVFDLRQAKGWTVYEPNEVWPHTEISPGEQRLFDGIWAVYFLEMKGLRPRIMGSARMWDGLRKVDVVSASVGDLAYEYYLVPKSDLPYRVRIYYHGKLSKEYRLEAYTRVDGIQLPTRVKHIWGGSETLEISWELNLPYDESVFSRPPKISDGPRAWERK